MLYVYKNNNSLILEEPNLEIEKEHSAVINTIKELTSIPNGRFIQVLLIEKSRYGHFISPHQIEFLIISMIN